MGQPAATVSCSTSHGDPLSPGPGSVNVLINDKPAWRAVMDYHKCSSWTVIIPHVGGVVVVGSMTVLINGMPAARMGDQIVEVGPPDDITEGSPDVLIG